MSELPEPLPTVEADPAANAARAWDAHVALLIMEQLRPSLRDNEFWQALRDTAFARFRSAFETGRRR